VAGAKRKTCGHLLGLDLRAPIAPSFPLAEIVAQIHSQGGLAVASRPHSEKSTWGKDTGFLWDQFEVLSHVLDAWEIATRKEMLRPAISKPVALLANSDFHKPKHIYSWKTVLRCELHAEAIKDCIRRNHEVAIVLYHDGLNADALQTSWRSHESEQPRSAPPELIPVAARS